MAGKDLYCDVAEDEMPIEMAEGAVLSSARAIMFHLADGESWKQDTKTRDNFRRLRGRRLESNTKTTRLVVFVYLPTTMALVPPLGPKHDFYQSNGNLDFSYFQSDLVPSLPPGHRIPIRLHRGDPVFGAIHIAKRHGHWLDRHNLDVASMVWMKLQHSGLVYTTEDDGKLKINLALNPHALLVMQLNSTGDFHPGASYFSVTSLYYSNSRLDGDPLGNYRGSGVVSPIPVFTLPTPPPPTPPPTVTTKKRRTIEVP